MLAELRSYDKEDDSGVKAEIERRLKLLEPKEVNQIKCSPPEFLRRR